MSTAAVKRYTVAEYLALERAAKVRHEFYDGEIFAMAGGSAPHSLISGNTITSLNLALQDRPCRVYNSDMRVKSYATGLYTYPDVSVVCDKHQFEDEQVDTLLNPLVLFEVLSESTEAYDRGKKFDHYRQIPTLQEYVLISQDRTKVEHYARQSNSNQWLMTVYSTPEEKLRLPALDVALPLSEIYSKVDFPPTEEATPEDDSAPQPR